MIVLVVKFFLPKKTRKMFTVVFFPHDTLKILILFENEGM